MKFSYGLIGNNIIPSTDKDTLEVTDSSGTTSFTATELIHEMKRLEKKRKREEFLRRTEHCKSNHIWL